MSHRKQLMPLLAVLLLCAVAVMPLLREDSACSHDSGLHYHRVVAMRAALGQGLLFTRWLPDLAFGYGYPFFNYRAPVSYYLGLGMYLTGLPLPLALDLVYVLSIMGCAVGAYLLGCDIFGPEAGFVAAIAYAYAPYQFLDSLLRANAPESVALALMPFLMWACRRLALEGGRRWFLTTTLLMVVFFLTHAISNLLFLPFLIAYCAALGLAYGRTGNWGRVGLAIGLALAITSFYWLPALAEQQYAQLNMSRVTRNNDFHYNFLGLAEIFSPPAAFDTSLMNPPMRIQLGFGQTILALVGLGVGVAQWRRAERSAGDESRIPASRREWLWSLALFGASAILLVFMSTDASVWLWENVPLLSFVQFPWRMIGRAALPVALLGAAVLSRSPEEPRESGAKTQLVLVGIAGLLILLAIPLTYPPLGYCPNDPYPTVQDIHQYEHRTRLVGVDPEGSYFPIWVEQRPDGSPLEAQYGTGETIARFDENSLPEGATLMAAEYGPNRARLTLDSPTRFRAQYLTFYFPGWQATVDGESAEVTPSDPEGLITFEVPAGQHEVEIRFGETSLRLAVDVLSAVSIGLLVLAALRSRRVQVRRSPTESAAPALALFVVAILLLGLKLGVVDQTDTIFRRPLLESEGTLPGVSVPLRVEYTDGLNLIGYELREAEVTTDGTLRVDLYWTALQRPTERYETVVQLVGPDGLLWSYQNSFRPRGYHRPVPTYNWEPGRYALDSHEVEPLPGTPPGRYELVVTIFDRDSLLPLSVVDALGQPSAPELTLQEVTLVRPRQPSEPPLPNRVNLPHGELTLLSANFDRDQAAPGDPVCFSAIWRAEAPRTRGPQYPPALTVSLAGPNGETSASYHVPIGPSWYPAENWTSGEVWLSQFELTLPPDLQGGIHTWHAELADSADHALQQLNVVAPQRSFTAPATRHLVDISIGELATLVGVDLAPDSVHPGDELTVNLVWRADDTGSASYHVFLHLLDPNGVLIAQSDGIPASWTRPTTGWVEGEYIIDTRILALPLGTRPGEYALSTGLYIPGGDRLRTSEGLDAIRLLTVEVE